MLRKAVLDAGAKQLDPFTVDVRGSLELYQQTAMVHRDAMLAAEVQWLQSNHIDLVVSDVVPIVCAAAAAAGIPAVCVSNFSWGESHAAYAECRVQHAATPAPAMQGCCAVIVQSHSSGCMAELLSVREAVGSCDMRCCSRGQ